MACRTPGVLSSGHPGNLDQTAIYMYPGETVISRILFPLRGYCDVRVKSNWWLRRFRRPVEYEPGGDFR